MAKGTRLSGVSSNTIYAKKYNSFYGVDFSKDESMVDDNHSPNAENLISDVSGFPEKRLGWRSIDTFSGRINGIYSFEGQTECMIIHSGTSLYKYSEEGQELIFEGIADKKSTGKYFKGKLCILTGEEYLVFDGEKCTRAGEAEEIYAPITHISRETLDVRTLNLSASDAFKAWESTGKYEDARDEAPNYGTVPEDIAVNLISPRRKNYFKLGTETFPLFVLDSTIDLGSRVIMKCISTGEVLFDLTYDTVRSYGQWFHSGQYEGINKDLLKSYDYTGSHTHVHVVIGNSTKNNCGYITCSPIRTALNGYTSIAGVDDFSIEFSHTVDGYADRINKCTVMDIFENRIFYSGNPDYPNTDWYSGVNDPLYVPDINYTEIGVDSEKIMGYLRTGSQQAILKEDGEDATIYMRSYATASSGKALFPVKQGTSGLGAISKGAICSFLDDPLYLTRNGVYAVALQDISSERALNPRSTRINRRLLKDNSLSDAAMCEWEGYLLLYVDGVVYVADSGQKTYTGNKTDTYEYEWYYWTNIPARVMHSKKGELWFGTEDGRLCKFNTDLKDENGRTRNAAFSDDGEAISAMWATNLSDDGDFMQEKTLIKKGSGIFLKSHNASEVSVYVRTEKDYDREIVYPKARSAAVAERQTQGKTTEYSLIPLNTRVKKYGAIQIICRNEKPNSSFGIGGIVRRYFKGNIRK